MITGAAGGLGSALADALAPTHTLFLAGRLGNFSHQRHVHVANILWHLPYGRELMHLGLQVMAYRNFVPDKYSPEITDREWAKLDGTLPDPAVFADVPGGADGRA